MPLLDISKVSETLKTLIKTHVSASPAWPSTTTLDVSLDPPDKLNGESKGETIGLYLYHLAEDGHYKNLPAPGRDEPPIRYTPMGLNLFYQLSAHSEAGVVNEQRMMGLAVKALRDYPVIDDSTEITASDGSEVDILHGDLKGNGNRFRIVLQPISHNEAVGFWTAGSTPLRLAAYYQVAVVLLEPEETRSRTGRVLSYGVHAFVSGAPRLDGSANTLFFTYPGESDPRKVELRPAQVPFVSDTPPPVGAEDEPKNGDVAFLGTDLTGDRTSLLLKSERWKEPIEADSSWAVKVRSGRVNATVQKTIGTGSDSADILPGVYAACVRRISRRVIPDGSVREFEHLSNRIPFMVTPRIDELRGPGLSGAAEAVDVRGWLFDYVDPSDPDFALELQVYVGSQRLAQSGTPPPSAGEFTVLDRETLSFVRPTDIQSESGKYFPLRVLVNGAESPPVWLGTP